jgi:hypothetical protein
LPMMVLNNWSGVDTAFAFVSLAAPVGSVFKHVFTC